MSAVIFGGFVALLITQNLPSTADIQKIELKIPLRVYSADKKLIAEYGDERRKPVELSKVPDTLIKAVLASEDDRFYSHPGIDIQGIIRAIISNYRNGGSLQGASTITMQVARNYFLSSEQTYSRKLREVMLAFKLETTLSKEDILGLYFNKIFLGHRAYGFGAAAEVYYGKSLDQLTLAEQAMLAGLPKAPSRSNPISNPERAKARRNYVLNRLKINNWIDDQQFESAKNAPLTAIKHAKKIELSAPYVAEMVRSALLEEYGEQAYWQGLSVYTSLDSTKQEAADAALRSGLLAYDQRHGYRGSVGTLSTELNPEEIVKELKKNQASRDIIPAAVLEVSAEKATLLNIHNETLNIDKEHLGWAAKYRTANVIGSKPKKVSSVLKKGDIVYIKPVTDGQWKLSQLPQIQGALVSIAPKSGKILALTGGFDYYFNKYNRATQARRQPGSGIKPFIYASALKKGYSPASLISGAPIVIEDQSLGTVWRPQNYSGKFYGPTSMRKALTKSMNIVSVRLLRAVGIDYARNYISQFGLNPDYLPKSLSLALGAGNLTPMEIATAYGALANSGYLVKPYIIEKIESRSGETIFERQPTELCDKCDLEDDTPQNIAPRAMSRQDNFLTVNMMQDVVRFGTARKALVLERNDLAGKTGTTNDYIDAWFSGFSPSIATTVWVGFDRPQTLGRAESGGRAALPIWIEYMREALKSIPEQKYPIPSGIVTRVDNDSQQPEYYSVNSNRQNSLLDDGGSRPNETIRGPANQQPSNVQNGLF